MANRNLTLFDKVLGGGMLAGKKTYLAAFGLAVTAILGYLGGDLNAVETIERLLLAFGAGSLRAGISKGAAQSDLVVGAVSLALLFALAACTPPTVASLQVETPKQRYAAAVSDYSAALAVMVGYRDACAAAPDRLFGDCVQHVKALRKLDSVAGEALADAGAAVEAGASNAGALLTAAVSAIAKIGAYMIEARVDADAFTVAWLSARSNIIIGATGPPERSRNAPVAGAFV